MENWLKLLNQEEQPKVARVYAVGQVARYARKSVKGDGFGCMKSIEDQDTETVDICKSLGLPTSSEDFYPEAPGNSGKAPYDGGGKHQIPEPKKIDEKGRRRTRPQLTRLVADVLSGQKKAVVVWSMCRLWRSVLICDFMLDLFEEFQVDLYDRNGKVDYSSPEGRSNVRALANQFETQRATSKAGVTRGLKSNRRKGKIASNPNCLGIRTAGVRTNKIVVVEDELRWVERIMRLFVGDDSDGPASPRTIAKIIAAEGFTFPDDLKRQRDGWNPRFPNRIFDWQIVKVLSNVRYVGFHPTANGSYKCDAFLNNGKPLVSVDLFARVQDRLASLRRIGNATKQERAFGSILLCGLDACPLQCQLLWAERAGAVREKYPVWRRVPRQEGWCDHILPNIRDEVLLSYVRDVLQPVLAARLAQPDFFSSNSGKAKLDEVRSQLADLRHQRDVELVDLAAGSWRTNPDLALNLATRLDEQIARLKGEVYRLETASTRVRSLDPYVQQLSSMNIAQQSEAVRQVIVWAAVVPSDLPSVISPETGEPARNPDQGRLLFLTSFGLYHTAVIEFGKHPKGYRKRTNSLRPALPHECIASVQDLPNPDLFVRQLSESWSRKGIDFDISRHAPGYQLLRCRKFEDSNNHHEKNKTFDERSASGSS